MDNTSLNTKAVDKITKLWNYNALFDLDQLQESYNTYCRYCNYAERRIKKIFEKLQVFFGLIDNEGKQKKEETKEDYEDEVFNNKNIAAVWCKDKEMREGFNLIVDLFQGNGDPNQSINMEEFLQFIKTPPFAEKEHICLTAMKQEILTEKVVEDLKKDFSQEIAEAILEAGRRDDFLVDPIRAFDFYSSCDENNLPITMWEIFSIFNFINGRSRNEPEKYHLCIVSSILEKVEMEGIWEKYENAELEKRRIIAEKKKKRDESNPRRSLEKFDDIE